MCGICGRVDFTLQRLFGLEHLRQMSTRLRHRGPDDDGAFARPGVGLAMRRLSIIDLAGGRQPIGNEDGSVQVVLNGEIYNYRDLRAELQRAGHHFRTESDTEVIAHLWEDAALEAFGRLRGMFAVALWDERRHTFVVARDRLGIKPLYYALRPDGLDFASEMKVLLALPETPRELDAASMAVYFTVGYIPPPETIFRGIRELAPGHHLVWRPGAPPVVAPFWSLAHPQDGARSEAQWLEALDAALADAVASHLVSDVPLAAFLSGGLDSATIVAYMARELREPPRTFTVRYRGACADADDETHLASLIARRYGTQHTVIDVWPKVAEVLDDIVDAFDQPMADESSVPTYYLTQAVAREVKVALSGLGGDELFGGYERHVGLTLSRPADLLPAWAARALGTAVGWAARRATRGGLAGDRAERFARSLGRAPAERYVGFVTRLWPEDLAALLRGSAAAEVGTDVVLDRLTRHFGRDPSAPLLPRALAMDYGQYLPGDILPLTDRLSMLHSLEVRVPLVDHRLVELVAQMPPSLKVRGTRKKVILRKLMSARLPPEVIAAPKRGFVGPTAAWLRTELRGLVQDSLAPSVLRRSGWLDPQYVQHMLGHHLSGASDRYTAALWAALLFAHWQARYVTGSATLKE